MQAASNAHVHVRAYAQSPTRACMHSVGIYAHLHAQMEKSKEIALHFTDLNTSRLVLPTLGLRASVAGQLGGGVSVCLRLLGDLGWGKSWFEVSMEIGKRYAHADTYTCVRTYAHKTLCAYTRTHMHRRTCARKNVLTHALCVKIHKKTQALGIQMV